MRTSITRYLEGGKSADLGGLYMELLKIAEPNLVLGESLVFQAAKQKRSNLDRQVRKPPTDNALTPSLMTPEEQVHVPLHTWPFSNYGSFTFSTPAARFPEPENLQAISYDNLRRYAGRWLDTSRCATCRKEEDCALLYCAYHQILQCQDCFNHNPCAELLGSVFRVEDLDTDLTTEDEDKQLLMFAAWQLFAGQDLVTSFHNVWGAAAPEPLEHQGSSSARGTRSKKLSQPATETVSEDPCASFRDSPHDCQAGMPDCEKQTVAFCSACSRVLCGPCSGNHHSAECQLIAFPPPAATVVRDHPALVSRSITRGEAPARGRFSHAGRASGDNRQAESYVVGLRSWGRSTCAAPIALTRKKSRAQDSHRRTFSRARLSRLRRRRSVSRLPGG